MFGCEAVRPYYGRSGVAQVLLLEYLYNQSLPCCKRIVHEVPKLICWCFASGLCWGREAIAATEALDDVGAMPTIAEPHPKATSRLLECSYI